MSTPAEPEPEPEPEPGAAAGHRSMFSDAVYSDDDPRFAEAKAEKMRAVRMESAKRMFQTVDADDSGFIDPIEFQRFMRKLDATMSATDIKLALGVLDEDGDGVISFTEFAAWWCSGEPKEVLRLLRSAMEHTGEEDNTPFTFSEDVAKAALANDLAADPESRKMMEEMKAGLESTTPELPQRPVREEPKALSEEEQKRKDKELQRMFQLDKIFKEFDKDGNGEIDADELRDLGEALGQTWSQKDAAAVLTEMDGDGNGAIDLAEMREWFMDFEEGGGGLLGIALRNELDQALEVGAALDAEINAFLDPTDSDSDKEDGDELGDMGAWGEVEEYDRPGNMHVTKSLGLTPQKDTTAYGDAVRAAHLGDDD